MKGAFRMVLWHTANVQELYFMWGQLSSHVETWTTSASVLVKWGYTFWPSSARFILSSPTFVVVIPSTTPDEAAPTRPLCRPFQLYSNQLRLTCFSFKECKWQFLMQYGAAQGSLIHQPSSARLHCVVASFHFALALCLRYQECMNFIFKMQI